MKPEHIGTPSLDDARPKKIVLLGVTGGIGAAMAGILVERGHNVVGFSRQTTPALFLESEPSIAAVAEAAGTDIDWLINATGVLFNHPGLPEKTIKGVQADAMLSQFLVNAVGPALILKHFSSRMRGGSLSVMASFSARVSSIGDNRLGGWYSYRASKAALNQIIKTTSIELRRTNPDVICVALHPGTVATRLSAPFSAPNARPAKEAAADLIAVMEGLTKENSGQLLDYQGRLIEW